jgi:hypothetical protein
MPAAGGASAAGIVSFSALFLTIARALSAPTLPAHNPLLKPEQAAALEQQQAQQQEGQVEQATGTQGVFKSQEASVPAAHLCATTYNDLQTWTDTFQQTSQATL